MRPHPPRRHRLPGKAEKEHLRPLYLRLAKIKRQIERGNKARGRMQRLGPVFSLYTGFDFRIWHTYGALIRASPPLEAVVTGSPLRVGGVATAGAS